MSNELLDFNFEFTSVSKQNQIDSESPKLIVMNVYRKESDIYATYISPTVTVFSRVHLKSSSYIILYLL
jgi:hypothetical protein